LRYVYLCTVLHRTLQLQYNTVVMVHDRYIPDTSTLDPDH
jgi:hypothetical protein